MFQSGTNIVSSAATGGPSSGPIMYWMNDVPSKPEVKQFVDGPKYSNYFSIKSHVQSPAAQLFQLSVPDPGPEHK